MAEVSGIVCSAGPYYLFPLPYQLLSCQLMAEVTSIVLLGCGDYLNKILLRVAIVHWYTLYIVAKAYLFSTCASPLS